MVGVMIQKATFKHVEAYVFAMRDIEKEMQRLREEIMAGNEEEDENWGGGSNSVRTPGRPTEKIATRLMSNKRLRNLEEIKESIWSAYREMNGDAQRVIEYRYWYNKRLDWKEVAYRTSLHEQTCFKYRKEFIIKIAEKVGWA